jgi:ParB family chromosome partitioning protein
MQSNPRNPRQRVEAIAELADSLREHGQLQPIVVRPIAGGYEVIAGHRRLEAARLLGWTEIAAIVRDVTDDQAYILMLVENLQREDLTPREEAAALEVLVRERGWSTRQVGEAIKRSHIYVSRRLRVFEDEILVGPVLADHLSVSTAEELLRVQPDLRPALVEQAVAERWGQAQARRAVVERNVPDGTPQRSREMVRAVKQLDALLDAGPISDLPARARTELRRLYQRLALLVAD